MALSPQQFLFKIGMGIAVRGRTRARGVIESRVLSQSLRIIPPARTRFGVRAGLLVPHYWAVYYHDGRGPVRPTQKQFVVYFKRGRKELDPRVRVGAWYPRRIEQVKRLNRAQFYAARKRGDLVITKKSGPADGKHFFTIGMRGFRLVAGAYAQIETRLWLTSILREQSERDTAKGSLG